MNCQALAATLRDAVALVGAWGERSRIVLYGTAETAEIIAPTLPHLSAAQAQAALRRGAERYFLCLGNQEKAPDFAALAPVLETLITASGIGFMAASLAAPALGRSVYQGHLFQDGRLLANLREVFSQSLSGRVTVIGHEVIAEGVPAIRRRLAGYREQGVALALLDAVDPAQCERVAEALEEQLLSAGPAWLSRRAGAPPAPTPTGPLAILSGALDRQTLFQLGAARSAGVPFFQLAFEAPDPTATALAWAGAQGEGIKIIAASATPDRLHNAAPVAGILAGIAAGLARTGHTRFVITGNDSAAAILAHLGVTTLAPGAAVSGLRWLSGGDYNFLLKPGGFGSKSLLLDEFEP
ncbi:MAG: hypothetical protein B7X08_05795 [Acidocella sp. 20-63-7]|nr:MAG: hypothetical protein B7X08_05795 [Acidocella sp. 20-63-7]HQT46298.1 four-carbon acid sugar kinase family protein [Acidocella sp.]